MKLLILAAGQGKRLRPLTNDKPKCMVRYQDKEIIKHILDATQGKFGQIAIVGGYKIDVLKEFLKDEHVSFFENEKYASSNMVKTLMYARDFFDDDVIISYADIVYKKEVLEKLIAFRGDFGVVVDRKWKELWKQRMEDPLSDAETLKIKQGKIKELGKKPKSYADIQGQYIGLIKISKNFLPKMISLYDSLDKNALFDGQDFDNMYMTSFIQAICDKFDNVKPVFIDGGWVEIDAKEDLDVLPV